MARFLRHSPRRQRWVAAFVGSIVVQCLLLGGLLVQLEPGESPSTVTKEKRPMRLQLLQDLRDAAEAVRTPAPPRQLVEVIKTETPKSIKEPAKFLADQNVRVKKQTKARARRAERRKKRRGQRVKVPKRSVLQSAEAKNAVPTSLPNPGKASVLSLPKTHKSVATSDPKKHHSPLFHGSEHRLLLPPSSLENALANLQILDGGAGSSDHLPDIAQGPETLLNADKYRFADYFYRIKAGVEDHWHPATAYRTRDPTGKIYGVKDRYTRLHVVLDATGALKRLTTVGSCGLNFMDAAARQAFRLAQPFSNPPRGLLKDGEIRFSFGFYFEISSGRHGFRWNRL